MPRRVKGPAMEKRGRNACWKCRERRIRCTLEKPTCSNCVRSKHACHYGIRLLWRDEALARGICFGRQGVFGQSSDVPSSSNPFTLNRFDGDVYFLNTIPQDYVEDYCHRPPSDAAIRHYSPNLRISHGEENKSPYDANTAGSLAVRHLRFVPSNDPDDSHFYDYFVNRMCPNLSNSPTDNPYWEFILPLSLTSTPLFHALLSWAANEASMTGCTNQSYRVAAVSYKVRALRGLRDEISATQGDLTIAPGNWASILTTIIMLSANDISEVCSSAWVEHLHAARVLCNMIWPSRPALPDDRFRRFCIMWFVSHDIMSRTAWIRKTLFEPSEWFAGDDEAEIDPMIACSRGVIQQVSAIGSLIAERRESASPLTVADDGDAMTRRRDAIEVSLHSLNQRVAARNDGCGSTDELLQVAESKRLCALIYLYACIDHATPSSPVIQRLTRRVIRILTEIPPKPSLIFPLFVVGTLGVCNEDDRRLILDKFSSLIKMRSLATAVKARDIVMNVWLDRDLGRYRRWEDLVETKSRMLSLA